jgi:predicted amidophosphoribosyltransferase
MMMVGRDEARVERDLSEGNLLCSGCGAQLHPWGRARKRKLRHGAKDIELEPRRARCDGCLSTHVLLPALCLLRRRDLAEVIIRALILRAQKVGQPQISTHTGVPLSTVRGWLSRFKERAGMIRAHFVRLAIELGLPASSILPAASTFADAVVALKVAHHQAVARLGPSDLSQFAASASVGLLINTSPHLPWSARQPTSS